jgi:hypothetical protein
VSPLVAILRSFCAGCLLSAGTLTAVAGTLAESARVDVLEDTLTGSSQGWEVLAYGSRVQLAKEEGALAGDWGMEIRSFPRRTETPSTDGVDQQWRIGLDRRFEGGNGIHTEGLFDESGFGPYAKGYRHSILYDWAILETENFRVSLGPGLVGDYALEPANGEERFNMMSRFGQSLSWRLHEGTSTSTSRPSLPTGSASGCPTRSTTRIPRTSEWNARTLASPPPSATASSRPAPNHKGCPPRPLVPERDAQGVALRRSSLGERKPVPGEQGAI